MTTEMVQLEVTLLMKADGSDSAWQMQRLCQSLGVKPVGVLETFIVRTSRDNADSLKKRTPEQWSEWAKNQRSGAYAFQVLEASVAEIIEDDGSSAEGKSADMSKDDLIDVLLPEIDRRHQLEEELKVEKIRTEALKKMLFDANQALRSSHAIASRDGELTDWENWRNTLTNILHAQHAVLWPRDERQLEPEPAPQQFDKHECCRCKWSNTNLLNYGQPGKARWLCHSCAADLICESPSPWLPDGWQVERYTELEEIPAGVNSMAITLEISRIIPPDSKDEPEEDPTCETCGGTGRVSMTDYQYIDRFTKWERREPYTISVECPDCKESVEG